MTPKPALRQKWFWMNPTLWILVGFANVSQRSKASEKDELVATYNVAPIARGVPRKTGMT